MTNNHDAAHHHRPPTTYPTSAICGGNCEVVKYFLERCVPSVSERNGNNKLPIHLLCMSGEDKVDHKSPEYVKAI